MVLDIAGHRLFKPVGIKKDEINKRSFLKLSLANKGLDGINLGNILHHKSVFSKFHHILRINPFTPFHTPVYECGTCTCAIMSFRFDIFNIEIMQHVFVVKYCCSYKYKT
jgi:hypothetical protein